jgi:hypothetical protein
MGPRLRGGDEVQARAGGGLLDIDWKDIARQLDTHGYALTNRVLSTKDCAALTKIYADYARFRSRVVMERHAYGKGEYKYFAYPLPDPVQRLRERLYAGLAPIANEWAGHLGETERYPERLDAFLAHCRQEGQGKPTPLLLRYEESGFNCLHQDRYGDIFFPLQATVLLNDAFSGGDFLLLEQRPRAQSRGEAVALEPGRAIIFPNSVRPVKGARGWYRTQMRHGVSRILSGERMTLGVIFHDAK